MGRGLPPRAGAEALKDILEGRMAGELDRHLAEMDRPGEADRRNGSYPRSPASPA